MRLALLILLAGCPTEPDDFPVNPGGGGGKGGNTGPDAATGGGDGSITVIPGRVCVTPDLRAPLTCAITGADGITVTLGTKTATTAVDGLFEIDAPSGSNLVWHASGAAIVSSVKPFTIDLTIPAILATDYNDLLTANGVLLQGGQGSIIVRSFDATNNPVAGATTTVAPAAPFLFYDGASATTWDRDTTSTLGTTWLPGTVVGTNTITVTPATGTPQTVAFTVEDNSITFATVEFP